MLVKSVLLASLASSAHAQLAYVLEVLPSPPGTTSTEVHDVGGLGAVGSAAHPSGAIEAVLWSAAGPVALPAPQVGTWWQVQALGVSAAHAVGYAYDGTSNTGVAIRWTGGVPAMLPIPPGAKYASALAVADDGIVAGWYLPLGGGVHEHACRWSSSDVWQALPEPVGAIASAAVSIRADGTLLGQYRDSNDFVGICAWTPAGQLSVLLDPGGQFFMPEAMAADGSVLGAYGGSLQSPTWVPFRSSGGAFTVLPTLTWQGVPMPFGGILDADSTGRAVGMSMDTTNTQRATLWHGSNVDDLQSLVLGTGNWILRSASAIDESGRIGCEGLLNGVPTAFLLHPATVESYCTAGTTTNGCAPSIGWTGTPQAGQSSGFVITVAGVEGQRAGILFYGIDNTGFAPTSWSLGSTSFLCVKAPAQRMTPMSSGGTLGQCDGTLSIDWLAYLAASPGALGQPLSAGQECFGQAWFRDPPAPKSTNLSDALKWVVHP